MNIIRIDSTRSTNTALKDLVSSENLPEGTVLITNHQTAGRGQMGTSWEADEGKNLTFSLLLHPNFLSLSQHFLLSEVIALGVRDAIDEIIGDVTVKWPNDIYYQDQKLCGILIENEITGTEISQSIIGIGVNVNQETFVSNAPNPVSIRQITGKETDLDQLLERIIQGILHNYQQLKEGNTETIARHYHDHLFRKEGFHTFSDKEGSFEAEIVSVENNGFLNLETDSGELRKYAFKEVRFVI